MPSDICTICHRPLSDPTSVERGIGPVCYGRMKRQDERQSSLPVPGEKILTEEMGGEIAELIRSTKGKSYSCIGSARDHTEVVGTWRGYPHDGGLADKDGKRWWPYQGCSESDYETSYWKVQNRIAVYESMDKGIEEVA